MSAVLRFDQVAAIRGGRLLFEQLDLALEPGAALLVRGANGSGKSSLLRLAAGLLRPSAGRVERAVAVALADAAPALDRELSLEGALSFWARLDGGGRLAAALDTFGLAALARVPVRMLSAGQAQRAMLARVAASGAPLWLLDEPLNGLDAEGAARLDAAVAGHRASGGVVVAASHAALGGDWRELELGR